MLDAEIVNDHAAIKTGEDACIPLPNIMNVSQVDVDGYNKKNRLDIQKLINKEMEKITPSLGAKLYLPYQ